MKSNRRRIVPIVAVVVMTAILPTQMGGCPDILGILLGGVTLPGVTNVTPAEAYDLIQDHQGDTDFVILDVRTSEEYAAGHIEGAVNICSTCTASLSFADALASLDINATYLVHCKSGVRSTSAIQVMLDAGFTNIYHLVAGINGWTTEGFPTVLSD